MPIFVNISPILKNIGEKIEIDEAEKISYADDGIDLVAPVNVKGVFTNTGTNILFSGKVDTVVKLSCGRCLSEFDYPLSFQMEEEYSRLNNRKKREEDNLEERELTAEDFVLSTGVNRLAISVGNIHGISMDEPALDIERIKKIREAVPKNVALVLHGGSGIPDKQIKAAIAVGIANIHINTDIRVAYTEALREEFSKNSEEVVPYKLDTTAREAVKKIVKEKLILFGAKNRI
ncbi:MAG: Fructose-1,6-bisphosphate aldolase, class II [Candidatus Giovannonibacteria bacterium GW2011_GWC2_43_8]|nr:MAG: Fructose-1,6-bisphosphate aldolase, class II [Candidatus Giovannonibacteria bacterium GW2011_GWC2_43_8]